MPAIDDIELSACSDSHAARVQEGAARAIRPLGVARRTTHPGPNETACIDDANAPAAQFGYIELSPGVWRRCGADG